MLQQTKYPQVGIGLIWPGLKLGLGYMSYSCLKRVKALKTTKQAMQQQTKQPQVGIGLICPGLKLGLGYSLTDKQPQVEIELIWPGLKLGLGYSLAENCWVLLQQEKIIFCHCVSQFFVVLIRFEKKSVLGDFVEGQKQNLLKIAGYDLI